MNELKWSMAGGGVRILIEIQSSVGVDLLMKQFILDCENEETTILPLAILSQTYFKSHQHEGGILKSLDTIFLKEQMRIH
ncbi:hypothetical protein [Vagococcus fluvialis]|uniref:hypothetical protein n=1 Tax=Vagococcus fluvialis TaxID=2738 RepID=UPI001A8DE18D|nr:hypothetical protein [Vagococcus fluvialis]MBO0436288.1 hypothetical protein [Vagococcus fluvialis]